MSAAVHLILGPPGADRTGPLLAAFRTASVGLGAALVLVPTRRHADRILDSLDGGAPLVFDLQSFADELVRVHDPDFRPHAEADRRLLLDSVLAQLRKSHLPYFTNVIETRGFFAAAMGYIAEMKAAEVDLRTLLKAGGKGKPAEKNRHMQATTIFDQYQKELAKLHRFDPPDRLGRAAQHWEGGKRRPFERVRSVFLAGFTSFTPLQKKLLDAVRTTVDHIWIELPDGEGEMFDGPRAARTWITTAPGPSSLLTTDPAAVEEARPALAASAKPHLIAAPGELGEARLVARHIRALLAEGAAPDRILVVARRLAHAEIDLLCEVLDEYAIPHDAEGANTLARDPGVAFLLRAWKLAQDDWPFAGVAAMLRSAFFRPDWPEVADDPEVPAAAETLLRMLGETRSREAYLKAVHEWEHTPPEPLEDEQAEEPLRKRKQRLARRCRPFLERFFTTWDSAKPGGSAETAVQHLKAFANDIGLSRAADGDGLTRFWLELDRWAAGERSSRARKLSAERFARVLAIVAASPGRARTRRGGGVQLLSAERAAGLDCDYLFLIGLGEGSWPDLAAPVSLLDDAERMRLRKARFALPDPAARLATEQLLFRTLTAAPRRGLVLSYPAVDHKGLALLPSSFLRDFLVAAGEVPTTRQRMLLDGYFHQAPLSAAELRVQSTHRLANDSRPGRARRPKELPADLLDNLDRAAAVARARFETDAFGPFDGALRHPAVAAELAERLGPNRVFSPTSLETYVACPFRFLLQNVLRLEQLVDPVEEVEHTRRGTAFHRALSRFHERIQAELPDAASGPTLPEGVTERLLAQLDRAVDEYARRAPSRATAELWRLEGERLKRAARRYRDHWTGFREPWNKQGATPVPHRFEAVFGTLDAGSAEPLVIAAGDLEVRIGGRIDRIDLAAVEDATGFWVIDYKTGRAANYSAKQVERFEKLQLPLYALAVERVLLKDRPARPLGLAYWLVTDTGHKPMLPAGRGAQSWLADPEKWATFREQLESWVATLVSHIRAGDFPLAPRSDHCTDTCDFGPLCRIAQSRNSGKVFALELPVMEK